MENETFFLKIFYINNNNKMAVLPPDPVYSFKSDMGFVHSICFPTIQNEYTDTLIASTESGKVYFWNLETNRLKMKLDVGESVQAIHHTETNLITQEKCGVLKLWDLKNENEYVLDKKYDCAGGYCRSVLFNSNLIVAQEQSCVDIVDIKSFNKVQTLKTSLEKLGHVMCVQIVELSAKFYVLAGYESGDIVLWDFYTSRTCGHIKLRECITSITFDKSTSRGICGNASNVIQIFTINKDFSITLKCEISITNDGCNVVKLRPDRKIFVSGGWDGRLRMFSWKSLRPLAVLTEHRGNLTDVAFSPAIVKQWRSNIMAACGSDGKISLWNLYN